jgi:hypothetical protein
MQGEIDELKVQLNQCLKQQEQQQQNQQQKQVK